MRRTERDKLIRRVLSVLFWIIAWQIISSIVKSEILIASPLAVGKALLKLIITENFWRSIAFSFLRIISGFLLGTGVGIILAVVSSYSKLIKDILYVPMSIIKATPVASFIIIALIWIKSENLSIFISFLMVVPIIYSNLLKGIEGVDTKLKEMMKVFKVTLGKKYRFLYIPSVMPFLTSALTVSLGLCWKAGIAAEVIGIPTGSIGESLYEAKIYLNTSELFAWTIVIIILSTLFEKLFLVSINYIEEKMFGGEGLEHSS